jgi:hypothetical protein
MNNSSSSSNSEAILINAIKNKILSSWGIIYLVIGSFGTVLNLIIFTRRALWSLSPCIPYMFASAMTAIPIMYVAILSRIGIGFQITPFYYIPILCKLQVFISNVSTSFTIWFTVGSCWDRYLSSSRSAVVRRMSSMRNTRRTICVIILCISTAYAQVFYCFEGNLFLAAAPCSAKNTPCSIIDTTLLFLIQFITPLLLIFYFGISTLLNIRHLKRPNQIIYVSNTHQTGTRNNLSADRTIQRMVFIQVVLLFICSLPTFTFRVYTNITLTTVKSSLRLSVENLIFNTTLMIYYFDKITSFYTYTLASRPFRKILWESITMIRPRNAVAPQN